MYDIWEHRNDQDQEQPIDWDRPQYLLMHKQDNDVFIQTLEKEAHLVRGELRAGSTLTEAIERAQAEGDPDENVVRGLFQLIVQAGLVKSISNQSKE